MAAVASFLDNMTAFAEGCPDFLGDAQIFPVNPHSIPSHGMATLLKLCKFLFVALPALFREDHGFCFKRRLMIRMAGDAVDSFFRML
jgi:hypothetical protein